MDWSDLLDGCRVLATLNEGGNAHATTPPSSYNWPRTRAYGVGAANHLLDDIIKEIRDGRQSR